jgi:hypothetical protein
MKTLLEEGGREGGGEQQHVHFLINLIFLSSLLAL